ncbi:MAG: restriction endonuclease [Planctomycetaceae bacterium]|nr:restriction endonuclease [Planctomycetaceae bacterium]
MAKKTSTKTKPTAVQQPVNFKKGGFYQDLGGELWFCTNAKQKKVGDDQLVMMQRTEDGQPVGEATEELVGSFNKQLSAAELKEYRVVCQRERDAEGENGSKAAPATAKPKPKAKKVKAATEQPKKMSALDAAVKVLGESAEPMATKELIDAMSAKGYWTSPGGQTPHATLYAAILREINTKGPEARFAKTDRGRFGFNAAAK